MIVYSHIGIVRGNGVSMERLSVDCSAAENAAGGKQIVVGKTLDCKSW